MKSPRSFLRSAARLTLAPACAAFAAASALAQQAAAPSATPAQLARYDANKNGRLDPEELAAMQAAEGGAGAASAATGAADDKPLQLSPFQVTTARDTGYAAENTTAGSRLATPITDLAASITVITRQQMDDTAALDINDVFKYEASTEGSSSFAPSITDRGTVKDTIAGYSFGNNGDTTTNAQSNRIRGLNAPDAAINNFSTNNRIPFDAYNIQSVEISRGPNSLLFGLGTPSGVVNTNAAQAVLNKQGGQVQVRLDHNGSNRGSVSFNQPLIADKLAAYGAVLYDNRQFERKPSSDLYRRQYGALTYKPFSKTLLRGFAENYRNDANRPNTFTPRDWVGPWLASGRPAYDPVARTVTLLDTGRVLGPYVSNVNSPGYNAAVNTIVGGNAFSTINTPLFAAGIAADDIGRPLRRIDNGQIVDFFARQPQFYAPAQTNPATATPTPASLGWTAGDPRYLFLDRMWTSSTGLPNPTTTVNGRTFTYGSFQNPGVTNKAIYDWTKYNTLQTNFARVKAQNYNLEFEQEILPNLHFSAGWLRQDIEDASNYTINQLQGATIAIDTNTKLPNGSVNPYFGLPFIFEGAGGGLDTFYAPETDDNYRAMLAYQLDFTKREGWMRWLGNHRLLGLWQEQDVMRAVERWRMNFIDGDADGRLRYVANPNTPGTAVWSNTATMRHYYMASPGDPQARATHSIGFYGNQGWQNPFSSPVTVWNYQNGQYQNDQLTEGLAFSSAGSFRTQREVKGTQFTMQSYLWEDRIIGTLGWRYDKYRARITTSGPITDPTGRTVEAALGNDRLFSNGVNGLVNRDLVMSRWNRWDRLEGGTRTLGVVLRPLRNMKFTRSIGGGEGSVVTQFLDGLQVHYNESSNFNPPATFQTDYFLRPLAKPTGQGKDFGVGFNLFNNKLVARVNWYETENLNERTGAAGTLLTRAIYSDTTTGIPWAETVVRIRNGLAAGRTLDQIIAVNNWNSNTVNPVNDTANQQKVWDLLKLPVNYYAGASPGATQDSKAKGVELQLTYNATRNWRMKLTASKDQATYRNVAPQYDQWIAQRLPVWTTMTASEIPDFTDPTTGIRYSLRNFWTGYGFVNVARVENTDGNTSPQAYYNNVVVSQIALAKALEGARSPAQREYHASYLTSYDFREGRLKGVGLGGSLRWESQAVIGYFGKVGDTVNSPTVINLNDVTRPVYDKGHYYSDIWMSYSRKLTPRIGWKLQLNVNNWMESGRLQATQVNFDGTPWAFRIIDPRQFILTSTFTF